jgi:hypothetical protein
MGRRCFCQGSKQLQGEGKQGKYEEPDKYEVTLSSKSLEKD